MPTKWLQGRTNGSKTAPGMPPRRVSRGLRLAWLNEMAEPRISYEMCFNLQTFWQSSLLHSMTFTSNIFKNATFRAFMTYKSVVNLINGSDSRCSGRVSGVKSTVLAKEVPESIIGVFHARPFVGASQVRSWSRWCGLGAILWAFIAKN